MPISEKEHFDALRTADQRAIELLATANADRIKQWQLTVSHLIAVASMLVAVVALLWNHH